MNIRNVDVCPVKYAGSLDNKIRRWFQNPKKILKPFIKEGMTSLDFGCGPGFFTLDMAQMVGQTGKVIAADLQAEMLEIVRKKTVGTILENRITFHQCGKENTGLTEKVDFVLLFYMVHEIPQKATFFQEIAEILNKNGLVLIVEPPFHVSNSGFKNTLEIAEKAGLRISSRLKMFPNKAAVLQKAQ